MESAKNSYTKKTYQEGFDEVEARLLGMLVGFDHDFSGAAGLGLHSAINTVIGGLWTLRRMLQGDMEDESK